MDQNKHEVRGCIFCYKREFIRTDMEAMCQFGTTYVERSVFGSIISQQKLNT